MCELASGVIFRLVFANQVCGLDMGPLLSGDILILQEGEWEVCSQNPPKTTFARGQ